MARPVYRLSQDIVRSFLLYSPEKGTFKWRSRDPSRVSNRKWNGKCAGEDAGSIDSYGYLSISITLNGVMRHYKAHRLAWFYVYGEIPDGKEVDHINRVITDNRIANLRLATKSQNGHNLTKPRKHSKSGKKGAQYRWRNDNYQARITVSGKRIYLGTFETAEQAHAAYVDAHARLLKEFSPYSSQGQR